METILLLHSWIRWIVLLAGVVAVAGAVAGAARRRAMPAAADVASRIFVISADVQLLLGIALFVLGPPWLGTLVSAPRQGVRIWAVDHALVMVGAIAIAHATRIAMRKKSGAAARSRTAAIGLGLALLLMLVAVPWATGFRHVVTIPIP